MYLCTLSSQVWSKMYSMFWKSIKGHCSSLWTCLLFGLCGEIHSRRCAKMSSVQDTSARQLPAHCLQKHWVRLKPYSLLVGSGIKLLTCSNLYMGSIYCMVELQWTAIFCVFNYSSSALSQHNEIRKCCNGFFLEVVSRFCLTDEEEPSEDLVELLFSLLISAQGGMILLQLIKSYDGEILTVLCACVQEMFIRQESSPRSWNVSTRAPWCALCCPNFFCNTGAYCDFRHTYCTIYTPMH